MKLKNVLKISAVPFCAVALLACNNGGSKDGKVQVTFKNYDGTVLQTERIDKGSDITYTQENVPSKPKQGSEVANIFVGWDKGLTNIQKDTTFIAQYKKLDKYIDKDHDGMPAGIDPDDNNNQFEVGVKSMVYFENQKITINFNQFLEEDNQQYHNEIAKLGLFLSNPKVDFKDGLFTDKAYGGRVNALYSRLGFDDYHHFDFKDEAVEKYKYDQNDTTSGVYGHKFLTDENGNIVKDLIVIAFEGTNGKRRWSSNFDIGLDDDSYYNKTGPHPEWDTDGKIYHKGFYVAAKRVFEEEIEDNQGSTIPGPVQFLKYVEEHSKNSPDGKPIIFITGHSRGGAMANIVGTYFDQKYKDKCIPFTYSFATPCVYGGSSGPQCPSIFNIINTDDIVTMVPHSTWGFSRLGTDIRQSIENQYKEQYATNRDKREYQYVKNADSMFALAGCKRDKIYTIEKTDANLSTSELATYDDETKANEDLPNIKKQYFDALGLEFSYFYELAVIEVQASLFVQHHWAIQAYNCFGIITNVIQKIMSNDKLFIANYDYWIPLVSNTKYKDLIISIAVNILAGGSDTIALPHDYGSYQVILSNHIG